MPREVPSLLDQQTILAVLFVARVYNTVSIRTFFQPDEYYQALEPAWNLAHPDGLAWITWEWRQHLRSAIHPAIFGLAFKVADLITSPLASRHLRDVSLLIAPKIVQATIAVLGDYYTWRLAYKIYGKSELALTAFCLTLLNPWQWFCSGRTFSNGLENTLTVVALYHWPLNWSSKDGTKNNTNSTRDTSGLSFNVSQLRKALILAAIATVIRPTNLLIWLVLAGFAVFSADHEQNTTKKLDDKTIHLSSSTPISRAKLLARESLMCGSVVLALSAVTDRIFYGVWTFPPLNFLHFNVVQSLAVFYGNNDWHYYLSQGYPLLLTTFLPFAIVAMYQILSNSDSLLSLDPTATRPLKWLAYVCIALPGALSVLSHKEVRFIYPILGPLHVIAAKPAWDFLRPVLGSRPATSRTKYTRTIILLFMISINVLVAIYTTTVHNSGLITLTEYLRTEFTTHYSPSLSSSTTIHSTPNNNKPTNMTIAFLMPCHSVPWRSHILHPASSSTPGILAWALTCEPPLHLTDPTSKQSYQDEADVFYANPSLWLRENMSRRPPWKFTNLKPTERYREPGVYNDNERRDNGKRLWGSIDDIDTDINVDTHNDNDYENNPNELDITHLLPYLRTTPGGDPPVLPPSPSPSSSPSSPSLPSSSVSQPIPSWTRQRPWPHYLIFFASLEPTMKRHLRGSGYKECWRVFNSHWHDDHRRVGDVVVWCLFPDRAR